MGQRLVSLRGNDEALKASATTSIALSDQVFDRLTSRMSKEPTPEPELRPETVSHDLQPEPVENPLMEDLESAVAENKKYWKKRLEDLQQTNEKIRVIMRTERDQGFEDVVGSMSKSDDKKAENPCKDSLSGVADCYKSNATQPLACAREVSEFASCYRDKMQEKLAKKDDDTTEQG